MPVHKSSLDTLLQRVRGEYLEMPGLRLTLAQAARLWNLDCTTCRKVLHVLTHDGFLVQSDTGTYGRADSVPLTRERIVDGAVRRDHRAPGSARAES